MKVGFVIMLVVGRSGGMADALRSGRSGGNPVEVQILSSAPNLGRKISKYHMTRWFFFCVKGVFVIMPIVGRSGGIGSLQLI